MWTLWICLRSTQVENWQMHKHWIFTFSYTHKDKHLHTTTQHWVHVGALINVCPLQAHRQTVSSHYLTIWSWRHLHVSSGEKKEKKTLLYKLNWKWFDSLTLVVTQPQRVWRCVFFRIYTTEDIHFPSLHFRNHAAVFQKFDISLISTHLLSVQYETLVMV